MSPKLYAIVSIVGLLLLGPSAVRGHEPVDDQALLQVFIYGLAVFDMEEQGDLKVRFPNERCHTKKVFVRPVGSDYVSLFATVTGPHASISLDYDGSNPPVAYAASTRWLMRPDEVAPGEYVLVPRNSPEMTFTRGTLETCALSLDPSLNSACTVVALPTNGVRRSVSEVMVVKDVLQLNGQSAEVKFACDSGCELANGDVARSDELDNCSSRNPNGCAQHEGKFFKHVIDVIIVNALDKDKPNCAPDVEGRNMVTNHASHLMGQFRQGTHGPPPPLTMMYSPECSLVGDHYECTGCSSQQPACWSYLRKYVGSIPAKPELFNAINLSACPLSGYP